MFCVVCRRGSQGERWGESGFRVCNKGKMGSELAIQFDKDECSSVVKLLVLDMDSYPK